MANKNKPKITQTKTSSGHIATIEERKTPYLLVPVKFHVRIYCQKQTSKVLYNSRKNCSQDAMDAISAWVAP